MELRLEVVRGPDRGKVLVFERDGPFVFGRAGPPDRDLQVLTDASVSRKHVVFDLAADGVRLAPLAPTAPVWVAGQQTQGTSLSQGQRVQLGRTVLRATWDVPADECKQAQAPAGALPRRTLASYALMDEIGRGSFGRVHEALDRETDQRVALKVFEPAADALEGDDVELREKALQLFLREMDVVSGLSHEHIVRALAVGRDGDRVFLAMELIDGPTLEEVVAMHGPQPVDDVVSIARQLLSALAYAHERNIVHRDVSAGNVILTGAPGRYTAKLLDFGFAKSRTESTSRALTATGDVRGNLGFISPECLRDSKRAGPSSDLFSLAATVVYALTARYWFGREISPRVIDAILDARALPLSEDRDDLRPEFVSWLNRSLARLPDSRWRSAQAMDEALATTFR